MSYISLLDNSILALFCQRINKLLQTSPYSLDLRQKVIEYVKKGGSQISAAKIFSINKNTVNSWWLRYCSEGHVNPRVRVGAKPSIAREEFISFVKANPNLDAEEIGAHFGISKTGAWYWLKKFGFSYKKKPIPTWKLMKKGGKNF